ncbi:MAG TPA: HAD family phosphatase [Candidatus Saccharimonadales bacterium]|nr:HAD family phosphatase [Candidatus Saccharimonadales bacterium]
MGIRPIEAIIYDYDGLLVDTEDVWFRACQSVCAPFGVSITEKHRLDLMRSGLSAYLVEQFKLPIEADELRPTLYGVVDAMLADGIPLMPGAVQSIDLLGARYPLAIGTGARTHQVERGLARVGIRERFRAVIGSDQLFNGEPLRGKPAPDIFLKAAYELGAEPAACLVLEDQPKGVAAARAGGMRCIAVPNRFLVDADYSEATRVIPHLGAISLELIEAL